MWLNTFEEVVKKYETTKVLVSSSHPVTQDIRPIGNRSKKWERIIKYDENTYGLTDGGYESSMYSGSTSRIDKEYSKGMTPIMWERTKQGDFITIRNGTVGSAHQARYKFIDMYMPTGMSLAINQGKQTVLLRGEVGYALPKTTYKWDWQNNKLLYPDDGLKLRFKVTGYGTYERAGDLIPTVAVRVDRETKKQYKPMIAEYFEWMCAIVPMLDHTWQGTRLYEESIKEWADKAGIRRTNVYNMQLTDIPTDVALQIMGDEAHEMRIPLAVLMNKRMDMHRADDEGDVKRIKARYNTCINKLFKLNVVTEI
jgi:hypothetical protein